MVVIKLKNIAKKYNIYHQNTHRYKTLRDTISNKIKENITFIHGKIQTRTSYGFRKKEEFWALNDISFEIRKGERLGLIGANGAGKTTLLKILSRITFPSKGSVYIKGQVSSLLEVGTGFHPELTGRENIYLNGSILGMKKSEIKKHFDEIVYFSGIEKFIDTPVKRYSSGMYVRLAFSVAAHLNSDILLIDEVLAVGDIEFQKKCIGKMKEITDNEIRTIIFVSHNMSAIKKFCSRAIMLDRGKKVIDDDTTKVIEEYLRSDKNPVSLVKWEQNKRPGNYQFKVSQVQLKNFKGEKTSRIHLSEKFNIEIIYEIINEGTLVQFSIILFDSEGNCIFGSLNNLENKYYGKPLSKGIFLSVCEVYGNLLNNGRYTISIVGASGNWSDSFRIDNVISFDLIDDGILKGDYLGNFSGSIRPLLKWETVKIE